MSERKPPGEHQINPEFSTLVNELPVNNREFGDISDVFYERNGEVKINPHTFNGAALEAAEKKQLIAIIKSEGGFIYFLTRTWFEEHPVQPKKQAVSASMRREAEVMRRQEEKEIAYEDLGKLVEQLGLHERTEIKKIKDERRMYRLVVSSEDNALAADIILSGDLKEVRNKLGAVKKILQLLEAYSLRGRYELVESKIHKKSELARYSLSIFPKHHGPREAEQVFIGSAAEIWKALHANYNEPNFEE